MEGKIWQKGIADDTTVANRRSIRSCFHLLAGLPRSRLDGEVFVGGAVFLASNGPCFVFRAGGSQSEAGWQPLGFFWPPRCRQRCWLAGWLAGGVETEREVLMRLRPRTECYGRAVGGSRDDWIPWDGGTDDGGAIFDEINDD